MTMASDSFQRAMDLIEVERPFDALPLLNKVIAENPQRAEAYVQRAKVRRRLKDEEGAIADYSQAIKLAPTATVYLARALVWLSLNQVKGAIADSREAVKLKPELAGGHRLLGKALGMLGDGKGAIAAYKQAARCYLEAKDKQNAQACLDAIKPLQALPDIDFSRSPKTNGQTSSKTNGTAAPVVSIDEFMLRVQAKYSVGQYESALKDVNWLLDCAPHQQQALCWRVLIQAHLGYREQAISSLAIAKQCYPDNRDVQFCQGQMRLILQDGYGAVEEFSTLLEKAQANDEPAARYFAARGRGYQMIGELEAAFKDYSNAVSIDSEDAALYELRAKIQQNTGEWEGAIADLQKAATLWLNQGNWKQHQHVVESVRKLRAQHQLEKQLQSQGSEKNNSSTVQIKSFLRHMPVVEVLFDGVASFDMVIDRNATHSIITKEMAARLKIEPVSYRYVYLIDGTPMELYVGRLRSVKIGGTIITDVYVAIAPDKETAVLGKNCFSAYSVRISGNEITFLRR